MDARNGHKSRSAKSISLGEGFLCLAEKNPVVPPNTGICGDKSLKNRWLMQQGAHGKQSSERMACQNAVRDGSVFGLYVRDQFVPKELQKLVRAATGSKAWVVRAAKAPQRVGRCHVPEPVGIRDCDNDQFR